MAEKVAVSQLQTLARKRLKTLVSNKEQEVRQYTCILLQYSHWEGGGVEGGREGGAPKFSNTPNCALCESSESLHVCCIVF